MITSLAEERHLYVAETIMRRVLRFKVQYDGSLSHREIYGPSTLSSLGFPDGLAFDEAENLWINFPVWNAVGYLNRRRELEMVLEDPEKESVEAAHEHLFRMG